MSTRLERASRRQRHEAVAAEIATSDARHLLAPKLAESRAAAPFRGAEARATASHETAHVVLAWWCRYDVSWVLIRRDGSGLMSYSTPGDLVDARVAAAGIAVSRAHGPKWANRYSGDESHARSAVIASPRGGGSIYHDVRRAVSGADAVLRRCAPLHQRLTDLLLERGALDFEELGRVLEHYEWMRSPWIHDRGGLAEGVP